MDAAHLDALEFQIQAARAASGWLRALATAADVYIWSDETVAAISDASKTYPSDAPISAVRPFARPMFWCYQRQAFLIDRSDVGLLWCRVVRDLLPQPFHASRCPLTATLSDVAASHRQYLALVVAGCAWLEQRIVTNQQIPIERHARKRFSREMHRMPSLRIVQLRRSLSNSRQLHGDVEWSCRWVVSGHWRQQYYPSRNAHQVKFIMPYLKGPEDAPLKPAARTIYAVAR